MKKLLLISSLLFSSLTHAVIVTLDFTLSLTDHNTIQYHSTFKNPKDTNWCLSSGKIIIVGNAPDPDADTAVIRFKIFVQEKVEAGKELICEPTINVAWDEKTELSVVQKVDGGKERKLMITVVATKTSDIEVGQ